MTAIDKSENGLSKSQFFENISKDTLSKIAHAIREEFVPANTTIFRQGDPGENFYIVSSGKVRVFRKGSEGVETNLSELGPGKCFGEMALLTGAARSAHVETIEETRLLVLAKAEFDRVLKNNPDVSLAFIKQMSVWLLRDEMMIEKEAERQSRAPHVSWVDFVVIIAVSLLCGIIFNLSNPNGINIFPKSWSVEEVTKVSSSMALAKHKEGRAIFIDARAESFYKLEHIEGAVNVPAALFDIMYMFELGEVDKMKDIIVYGRTLSSLYDEHVARKLILHGHKGTMILEAGLSACKKKGFPVKP